MTAMPVSSARGGLAPFLCRSGWKAAASAHLLRIIHRQFLFVNTLDARIPGLKWVYPPKPSPPRPLTTPALLSHRTPDRRERRETALDLSLKPPLDVTWI